MLKTKSKLKFLEFRDRLVNMSEEELVDSERRSLIETLEKEIEELESEILNFERIWKAK